MFYYVLDYAKGCCDIFSAPEYEETYDVECMLQNKGYNLEDIEWMLMNKDLTWRYYE